MVKPKAGSVGPGARDSALLELLPLLQGSAELKWANHSASPPFPRLPMERKGNLFKGSEGYSSPSYFLLLRVPSFTHRPPSWEPRPRCWSPAAVRLRAPPGHAPFGAPPQPRLLARKCARAPARWRLRPSRYGLSAACPACCSSCPSATFCRAMVSSRLRGRTGRAGGKRVS